MRLKLLLLGCLSIALFVGALRFLPSGDGPPSVGSESPTAETLDQEPMAMDGITDGLADLDQGATRTGQRQSAFATQASDIPSTVAMGDPTPWTIDAIIDLPDGLANPAALIAPDELIVYAHETRVSPVQIQRELHSANDSITYERIGSNLFEGMESTVSSSGSLVEDAFGTAPVERQVIDGEDVWVASITLPANRERAFLHAIGGGLSTYRAVEARVDAPRVRLHPVIRAGVRLKATSSVQGVKLEGAHARLELKRTTAARSRSSDPSLTAYRADRGLDAANETLFEGVPSGAQLTATIFHTTLAPSEITISPLSLGELREETFELETGVAVSGRVVGEDGSAVANATVTAALPGESFGLDDEVFRSSESLSDGTFILPGLPNSLSLIHI